METKHKPGEWTIEKKYVQRYNDEPGGYHYTVTRPAKPIGNIPVKPGLIEKVCTVHDEETAKLIAAAPELLKDHLSDVTMIEDLIKDLKDGKKRDVIYFLENLLVSKKSVIKKATE